MEMYSIKEMMQMEKENKLDFKGLYQSKRFNEINTIDYFIEKYADTDVVESLIDFKERGIEWINDRGMNKFEWLDRSDVLLLNENVFEYLKD